jgi:hypothetical protein
LNVSRSRFSPVTATVAVIGVALLIYTVQRVGGWPAVVSGIASLGWWFLAVIALGAARMAVRARAWTLCAANPGAGGLSFADAFGAILAGDAAGNLTPLGLLASEPTKMLLARGQISAVTSIASVMIENAFYTASVCVVLLGGTWLFLQRADVPAGLEQISEAIVVLVFLGGLVAVWATRTQPAVLSRLAPIVTRLARRADAPADAVREVEARIYGVLQWPAARILHATVWEASFHLLAVAEVWLVLRLLPGGGQLTLVDAFLMESAGRFVTIAFKFVPYRLGIDEVGSGAVAQALGLTAANGVTLALVRRLRILVLNTAGLIKLARGR